MSPEVQNMLLYIENNIPKYLFYNSSQEKQIIIDTLKEFKKKYHKIWYQLVTKPVFRVSSLPVCSLHNSWLVRTGINIYECPMCSGISNTICNNTCYFLCNSLEFIMVKRINRTINAVKIYYDEPNDETRFHALEI